MSGTEVLTDGVNAGDLASKQGLPYEEPEGIVVPAGSLGERAAWVESAETVEERQERATAVYEHERDSGSLTDADYETLVSGSLARAVSGPTTAETVEALAVAGSVEQVGDVLRQDARPAVVEAANRRVDEIEASVASTPQEVPPAVAEANPEEPVEGTTGADIVGDPAPEQVDVEPNAEAETPDGEQETATPIPDDYDFDKNIDDIKADVQANPSWAMPIFEHETANKDRVTLTAWLAEQIDSAGAGAGNTTEEN